jgi:hypothetical protein
VVSWLTGVGCGGCESADSGAGEEVNCGDDGDGVTVGSGVGADMLSGCAVYWRKMMLS